MIEVFIRLLRSLKERVLGTPQSEAPPAVPVALPPAKTVPVATPNASEEEAIDTLARTIWGEARNEGRAGMEAVASVVMNRVAHPGWWGHGVVGVCRAPWQFSCWNSNDPNRAKLLAVDGRDPRFVIALDVATEAVEGKLVDPTGGADSYANLSVCDPAWAAKSPQKFTCKIGNHSFYKLFT